VSVSAEEVSVARRPPTDLSARNVVPGTVEGMRTLDDGSVLVCAGGWLARLTPASVEELEIEEGQAVVLLVKTHGWRVVAASPPAGRPIC